MLSRIVKTLASRDAALFVMLAWACLLVVWVVPFLLLGFPEAQIRSIVLREPFFLAIYAAAATTVVVCTARFSRAAVMRSRTEPRLVRPSNESEPQAAAHTPFDAERIAAVLSSSGFRHQRRDEGWVWGVRRPWTPVGTTLFHIAALCAGIAIVVQGMIGAGFVGDLVLSEGERFDGDPAAYVDASSPTAAPRQLEFSVREVRPEFYQDILLFTRLEADVEEPDGTVRTIRLSSPWLARADTMIAIKDFGYALDVHARSDAASVTTSATYKLKAFPSGQQDSFEIVVGQTRYRVYATVFADYVDRGGQPGVKTFNTRNPYVLVDVARVLGDGSERVLRRRELVPVGAGVDAGSLTLRFPRLRHYAVFRVTRMPETPLVSMTLALLACSVCLRLVAPRIEVLVEAGGESDVARVTVRADVYGDDVARARMIAERIDAHGCG